MKFFQKFGVFMHVDFYHFQYFGLILVKMKAFQKIVFINILRIKSSTSSEIFIKIDHHFGMTWLSSCGMTLYSSSNNANKLTNSVEQLQECSTVKFDL